MKLTKIAEDIHLYENFITKEECKNAINLLDHMASLDKDFYKGISFYESYSSRYPDDGDPILKQFNLTPTWFPDLENKFKQTVSELSGVPFNKVSKILKISKYLIFKVEYSEVHPSKSSLLSKFFAIRVVLSNSFSKLFFVPSNFLSVILYSS